MFVRIAVVAFIAVAAWAWLVLPSEGAGREHVYLVKPTDTLWSIAATHYAGDPRAAVWKLRERNRLESATIRPGQRLVLPAASS